MPKITQSFGKGLQVLTLNATDSLLALRCLKTLLETLIFNVECITKRRKTSCWN